jgi:hypothetical protein
MGRGGRSQPGGTGFGHPADICAQKVNKVVHRLRLADQSVCGLVFDGERKPEGRDKRGRQRAHESREA